MCKKRQLYFFVRCLMSQVNSCTMLLKTSSSQNGFPEKFKLSSATAIGGLRNFDFSETEVRHVGLTHFLIETSHWFGIIGIFEMPSRLATLMTKCFEFPVYLEKEYTESEAIQFGGKVLWFHEGILFSCFFKACTKNWWNQLVCLITLV